MLREIIPWYDAIPLTYTTVFTPISYQRKASKQSKAATSGPSTNKQVTLQSAVKSRDLREEFVLDAVSLFTHADIPLHKVDKMRPFLQKYCQQAGSLP